ncbi:hypothetical protein [Mesorhizobium sp. ES1-6]|uniref:hypothetical protein n=1 Tax=Mesorhizobium sp. ES1-6 TaxID=2876626 RepID=UPI001CCCFC40|nr:hypothetical protein [Mesorhizobium sp. ES1-6]MBZ9803384.1 hypothetical protein [Mesorhizobium sp. ES1-6]
MSEHHNAESGRRAKKIETDAEMGWFDAIACSFFNKSIDFYPRLGTQKIESVPSSAIIAEMVEATKHWNEFESTDANLDKAIELARASLNEAKQQTEYQDQKATRLLTVTTFLTALAGAFFTTFTGEYPLQTIGAVPVGWSLLLAGTYLSFVLFVLSALTGALVTFHGTRTTFKYPAEATVVGQAGPTRSYLFFREMIGVSPTGWVNSFVTAIEKDGKTIAVLKPDLKVKYLENYVSEAYLVATKTADKLRYLQPAQILLASALRFLLVYVVLLVIVKATINPTKPAPDSCGIELSLSLGPMVNNLVSGTAAPGPCKGP